MTDVKKFLILTADMGFGHRSAAGAIAAGLQESYGEACQVEIASPLEGEHVPAILRSSAAYDRIVTELPELYKIGYEASSAAVPGAMIESALTLALYESMRDLLERIQPDVIISTYPYYQAPLAALFTIHRKCVPLLTVITDLISVHSVWFNRASDLTLTPTEIVYHMALDAGLTEEKLALTGIPVHPRLGRRDCTQDELRAKLGWQPGVTTLLAVGSKRVKSMAGALDALNHSGLPLQLAVVAGGDGALYKQLQQTEWHLPASVYNFVDNLAEMMQAADCILCKAGGLIVTEALACGLPLLLVDVLPGQEVGNAEYVVAGGAGELAEDSLAAVKIMCHWLLNDGELLRQRARDACRLGRPHAADEIARLAWEAAERRSAELSAAGEEKTSLRRSLVDLLERAGISLERRPKEYEPGN